MALRCFLFSSDEETVANLRQILEGLGVDAEACPDAVKAAEKITNQNFQIVIIDWDQLPEAGALLNTARERKASERPLTLALVSNDASAPQALQAGANSLLRKPILINQARETLTTARDLLRAKQGGSNGTSPAGAVASSASMQPAGRTLRAGEFLENLSPVPSAQGPKELPVVPPTEHPREAGGLLRDLESMATAAVPEPVAPISAPQSPALFPGLQKMLRSDLASQPAPAPALPSPTAPRGNPELAGYSDTSSFSAHPARAPKMADTKIAETIALPPLVPRSQWKPARETERPAPLFSYIAEGEETGEGRTAGRGLKKRAILVASALAACAILAAPQAPWHPRLEALGKSGRRSLHAWLYPQPVTPAQAPATHENFARAGDEYKLPVAESIPDSTTDPSQIQVIPVVDPTTKKPNAEAGQPDQLAVQPETSPTNTTAQTTGQAPIVQPSQNQGPATQTPPSLITTTAQPGVVIATAASQPAAATVISAQANTSRSETTAAASGSLSTPVAPHRYPPPRAPSMPGNLPSSLKSQLAPATPDPVAPRMPGGAMPSIEPVTVTETAERALLIAQTAPVYPANAKGQQGSVTLQVLVGRDGNVQDAKFLQGSFVFARNAIDAVRQWKFKPYVLNGHPVSVQVPLTVKINPAQ